MNQPEFLRRLVNELNRSSIPFMITGSLASSYHGEPRSSYDIDLVVDPTGPALREFVAAMQRDCYVDARAAEHALQSRTMFNIIEFASGVKADLIIRKERPYSVEEFGRRTPARVMGVSASIVTAEDAILSKLEWSKLGQSERQYRDALRVAQVSSDTLDRDYLRRWAPQLGVQNLCQRLLDESIGD